MAPMPHSAAMPPPPASNRTSTPPGCCAPEPAGPRQTAAVAQSFDGPRRTRSLLQRPTRSAEARQRLYNQWKHYASSDNAKLDLWSHAWSKHDIERADTAVCPRLNYLSASPLVGRRPTNDRKR